MADEFDIKAHLVIDDKPAARGLDQVDRRIHQTEGVAKGAGSTISKALGAAFAAVAAAGIGRGLMSAARGVIGLQGEVQQAEGGIATLLSVITKMPIGDAMKAAQNEVSELSRLAAGGVGSLQDYRNAFQAILAPGLNAGANTAELRELTKNAISATNALGKPLDLAGTDVSRALRQGLSETETPVSIAAARAVGVSADKFRSMRPEERLATLTKGFMEFSDGAKVMGQTWEAQSATLQDGIKALIRQVTKPLFNRWSEQLGRVNQWLADNQDELGRMVEVWAPRLVELWDRLIEKAGTYAAIVAGASIAQALPALPGTPGGKGAGGAGGLLSRVTGFGGAAAGGAGAGGGGFMAALRGLGGVFVRAAGPIAIVTALLMGVAGAFTEFPGLLIMLKDAGMGLMEALGNIANSFGFLTGQGSALNLVGAGVLLLFTGLAKALTLVANGIALVIDALGILVSLMGDVFRFATTGVAGLVQLLTGDKEGAFETTRGLEAELARSAETRKAAVDDINRILFGAGKDKAGAGEDGAAVPGVGGVGGVSAPGTVNNIGSINVQVKAEVNEDPARVASAFDEVLDGLRRFTTQPKRLPTGPNLG